MEKAGAAGRAGKSRRLEDGAMSVGPVMLGMIWIFATLLALVVAVPAYAEVASSTKARPALEFVGSARCAGCHARQFQDWKYEFYWYFEPKQRMTVFDIRERLDEDYGVHVKGDEDGNFTMRLLFKLPARRGDPTARPS